MSASAVLRRLLSSTGTLALAVMAVTTVLAAGLDSIPKFVQYAPFVVSVFILGLPHGAIDYVVPARYGAAPIWSSIAIVSLLYAVVGGAYLVGWFVAPVASFVFFILLTWFHWGQGDVVHAIAELDAPQYNTRLGRALGIFVRGGLPMGLPLVFFPTEYQQVAEYSISLFATGNTSLSWFFTPTTRFVIGGALVITTLLLLLTGWVNATSKADNWSVQTSAAELCLLWLFFALVPPILAVGVYFCFWHAVRHIRRVVSGTNSSWSDFAVDVTPTTFGAIGITVALGLLVPARPQSLSSALGVYLVAIAVFTLPHVVIVLWMDYWEGLWSTD